MVCVLGVGGTELQNHFLLKYKVLKVYPYVLLIYCLNLSVQRQCTETLKKIKENKTQKEKCLLPGIIIMGVFFS